MEKISELMDGELDSYEASIHLKRLKDEQKLQENWSLYHLVGDALRQERSLSTRITRSVSARLEREPTVMAPRYTAPRRASWYAMSAAAGVAGLAVVGWLAFTGLPGGTDARQVALSPAAKVNAAVTPEADLALPTALASDGAEVEDYLLAHQSASDFRTMRGAPLYLQPVAAEASR